MTEGVLRIGVAGLGTVGLGVIRTLAAHGDLIARRAGQKIVVTAVSARERGRDRGVDLSPYAWVEDTAALADHPEVDVVVELIGGSEGTALALAERTLAAGKPLVTANKALVARHGRALATLAPYVLTTSLRDTMAWQSQEGVTTQWTAMGEGGVDFRAFFKLFAEMCPGVTVHIETISGFPRTFPIYAADFWRQFPTARAEDLAAFLAIAQRGKPIPPFKPPQEGKAAAEQRYQLAELDRSIRHCRDVLGLGA